MAVSALKVLERAEKPHVSRREGFTPGVIFGGGIKEGISIKFEIGQFNKILKHRVQNARLQLVLGDTTRFCLVKDVQKEVLSGKILHVGFQAVSENEIVKLKIPINYEGVGSLEAQKLLLLTNEMEIELEGALSLLPESISVEVGDKKAGDKVLVSDLKLNSGIKTPRMDESTILAAVTAHKETVDEEATTESPEPEKENEK